MERNFTEQELVRREKLKNLVNLGIDPFGHRFERTGYALDIKEKYSGISHDEFENRINKLERQIKNLDTRLQKLESASLEVNDSNLYMI